MLSCNQRKQGIPYEPKGTYTMGHAIDYMVFDRKMPRTQMLEAVEHWAKENVDPYEHSEDGDIWNIDVYNGSLNGDRAWHEDTVYSCRQDAEDAIGRMDKGFYDDHAVLFYDVDSLKPTAVMKDIKRRQDETMMKREALIADSHTWAGRKSKYVTCEDCGSKLNVERLRSMSTCVCPLCRNDLRSETVLNRVKAYDEKIRELRGKYAKEMKKLKSKAAVKWLVKMEVHCWTLLCLQVMDGNLKWYGSHHFFVVSLVRHWKCRPTGSIRGVIMQQGRKARITVEPMRPCNTLCFPNHIVPVPCLFLHGSCHNVNSHDNQCSQWNRGVMQRDCAGHACMRSRWMDYHWRYHGVGCEPSDDNCFSMAICLMSIRRYLPKRMIVACSVAVRIRGGWLASIHEVNSALRDDESNAD